MFHIAEAMVRWLAPILSFTSEEIWKFMPGKRGESVQCETWHLVPEAPAADIDWDALIALRAAVMRELEKLREGGVIGAPLEARVDVWCQPAQLARHAALGDELRFLLITSAARVHPGEAPAGAVAVADGVAIRVAPVEAPKCVRCWHRLPDVGSDAEHPELCGRCVTNLGAEGETRRYA
jgi:isoleucyl-tRNA synthetase